jgi:pyrimidine-nucleoside phosphorylase
VSVVNPVEVIRRKRDGLALSTEEISAFVSGAAKGAIPEYQTAAFLMATFFQGMAPEETVALTRAMIESGRTVAFSDGKPKIDKHSTGGVGDKVSIVLAPLVAALGVDVPMVSGRGLGHTGGTLDKLESIPGFRVMISIEEFTALIAKHGLAMMGQTSDFVPADKLLYALRDVTATVECIPLITASILSKKVAEGISGLVLDIKVGSGAFMKTQKDAERLAKSLVSVGTKLGLRVRAVLTDMSQPLGLAVGHAVEIIECLDVLGSRRARRQHALARGESRKKRLCLEDRRPGHGASPDDFGWRPAQNQ